MKKQKFILGFLLLTILFSGCKPFASISISPETACPGDEIWVKWRTNNLRGKELYRNGERLLPLQSLASTDSIRVNQTERSTYRIVGTKDDVHYEASVTSIVIPPGENRLKNFNFIWPGCIGSNSGRYPELDDLSIGGSIEVKGVANSSDRRIRVSHGGRMTIMDSRDSTTEFNGLNLSGEWRMEVLDLRSNEGCRQGDTITGEIYIDPPTIVLGVTYGCR